MKKSPPDAKPKYRTKKNIYIYIKQGFYQYLPTMTKSFLARITSDTIVEISGILMKTIKAA